MNHLLQIALLTASINTGNMVASNQQTGSFVSIVKYNAKPGPTVDTKIQQ